MAQNPCAEICMELGHYFYGLKDYEEAVLWYLNAASETPSIIDIHSSGDAPLACLSKCYSTLAAQAKQDKNAELSAAFLAQAEDYQAQAKTGSQRFKQKGTGHRISAAVCSFFCYVRFTSSTSSTS